MIKHLPKTYLISGIELDPFNKQQAIQDLLIDRVNHRLIIGYQGLSV